MKGSRDTGEGVGEVGGGGRERNNEATNGKGEEAGRVQV